MPPKSKGKKKKGGKSSKSTPKSKQRDEEILTFNEAVLLYQLQAKQRQLEELQSDVEDIQRRISRQKDRNKSLKEEKQKYMDEAIRQAKEHDIEMRKKTEVTHEEVDAALKERLAAARKEEEDVNDMKNQICKLGEQIVETNVELKRYEDYRDRVQYENATQIKLLEKEMVDMDESYAELSEFFVRNLESIKMQIERTTKESMDSEKKLASELALESMDVSTHREFSDNKWLLQEVNIHREHMADIQEIVEDLEKKNVDIMATLLDSQFEDVRISKDFFSACDNEDPPLAIEGAPVEESEEIIDSSDHEDDTNDVDWLDNYFSSFDDNNDEEHLPLATLDLKMLCIVGKKKPIHKELSLNDEERFEDIQESDTARQMIWLTKDLP